MYESKCADRQNIFIIDFKKKYKINKNYIIIKLYYDYYFIIIIKLKFLCI